MIGATGLNYCRQGRSRSLPQRSMGLVVQRVKYFLPLVIFFVLAGFLFRGLELDPTDMPSALIDKPMPAFSLPTLDGRQVDESVFKGQVSLLNVWATWCISCRAEHPQLNALSAQGVVVVGLNYKDDTAQAIKWLKDLGDPYRLTVIDQSGRLGIDLGVFGAPETFIIDKRGMIRYKHVGVIDERVWKNTLQPIYSRLLAE